MLFHQQGTACANLHTDDLDIEAPADLLNLDHGKKLSVGKAVHLMRHGRFNRSARTSYIDAAIKKSNDSRPGRLYIDPYGATSGNLWAENYEMTRYQKGGQTSLAGRSNYLRATPLVQTKMDRRQIERSRFVLDETTQIGARFVPALKPACKRDTGPGGWPRRPSRAPSPLAAACHPASRPCSARVHRPAASRRPFPLADPYDVGRHDLWSIADVHFGKDQSLWTTESLRRRDTSLIRPQKLKLKAAL